MPKIRFVNVFKIKWLKSKEKIYLGGMWSYGLTHLNQFPYSKLHGDAPDSYSAFPFVSSCILMFTLYISVTIKSCRKLAGSDECGL